MEYETPSNQTVLLWSTPSFLPRRASASARGRRRPPNLLYHASFQPPIIIKHAGEMSHSVEFEGFVRTDFECNVTKFAPRQVPSSLA